MTRCFASTEWKRCIRPVRAVLLEQLEPFRQRTEAVLGKGSCRRVSVRTTGGTQLISAPYHAKAGDRTIRFCLRSFTQ